MCAVQRRDPAVQSQTEEQEVSRSQQDVAHRRQGNVYTLLLLLLLTASCDGATELVSVPSE